MRYCQTRFLPPVPLPRPPSGRTRRLRPGYLLELAGVGATMAAFMAAAMF